MAISVAPLTTVVMSAVDQDRAGAASGINNAVARVAGLLAVAVFGIVMVRAFAARLDHELATLPISQRAHAELQSARTKLAAIEIPSDIDPRLAQAVKVAVSRSFVYAFRLVACCCAVLAIVSSLTAALLIEGKSPSSW
jgi:hypothetical protein